MANWLTYRIKVGDDVLVLGDEAAQELIKNETERSKKADAQTASFLESTTTNGIIRNRKSDPFGQTAIGGMKVVIDKGDLIINGNIKNHARLTRTYNVTQENRTEVFLYRFDSATNEIAGLWRDCIIQGEIILSREDKTELPLRSGGYYDILICKITIPAGATEITQDMIGDFRQNEYYCGYAKNLLVEIDETLTKSDAAADAAAVGTVISDLRKETRTRDIITEKRITNLEAGLPAERWSVDDSVANTKDVPENALPFASVDKVGGITRKCTNLLRCTTESKTVNGVTFTDNDGIITVNGTATSDATFAIGYYRLIANEKYTFSGCPAGGSGNTYYVRLVGFGNDIGSGLQVNTPYDFNTGAEITIKSGYTANNLMIKPMLNFGDTALPYEPYFDGLRSAPVTEVESVGVNLFDNISTKQHIEMGFFDDNAVFKDSSTTGHTELKMRVESDTKYTIHGNALVSQTGKWRVHRIYFYDRNKNWISRTSLITTESYTFRTPIDCAYIDVQIAVYGDIVDYSTININKGSTALPYTPYRRNTLPIPAEVQALDGYGEGNPDNAEEYNAIICKDGKWKYSHKGDIDNNVWIPLATTEITDISDLLPDDNLIGVEGGGTVTMVNEYGYDVPSEITYQLKGAEA